MLRTWFFDLSEIAAIGSISILFIHTVTHIGHLKLISETGASKLLVVLATLFSSVAMLLALDYVSKNSDHVIVVLIGFVSVAVVTEIFLQKIAKREIRPRI